MHFTLQPWQFYLVIIGGWIHRQQQEVIEYLRTENQVLKEKLGPKRILLNDDQRRRLAVRGKALGSTTSQTWADHQLTNGCKSLDFIALTVPRNTLTERAHCAQRSSAKRQLLMLQKN